MCGEQLTFQTISIISFKQRQPFSNIILPTDKSADVNVKGTAQLLIYERDTDDDF
jgi:hypothetical protein